MMAVFHKMFPNLKSLSNCSTFVLIVGLILNVVDSKKAPECSTCKEIVDDFHKGLSATEKSNYGGGNTNWEEKSLGSYAFSEVRLVEIIEKLCHEKSKCHTMLEEHEELVESFWYTQYAKKTNKDFFSFLCIENIKACCPNNTYGKDCSPCPGGAERPCQGNGKCSGEGTRKGTGKCVCSSGYKGDLCSECKTGHYEESKNDTHTVCRVCDMSCKDGCSGEGPTACEECKDGWVEDASLGCKDVNECLEEPCEDNQYCTNTLGSHTCFTCDIACTSCTGAGPSKCNECKEGYEHLDDGKCQDKDECKLDSSLCSKTNEECFNTEGGYECICSTGYEYKEDECVKSPKEDGDDVDDDKTKVEEDTKIENKDEL